MVAKFGQKLKELRIKKGLTLREFCVENHFDPGNYSKIERGMFAPPGPEKIREYALALGVAVGSDTYVELLDAASIDRGELPTDLLNNDKVVEELPVLFRTLRGHPVSRENLKKLADLLRVR